MAHFKTWLMDSNKKSLETPGSVMRQLKTFMVRFIHARFEIQFAVKF